MNTRHLYIHVPFCARRCSYCDFSIAVRSKVPVDEYLAALRTELALRFTNTRPTLDTVYLGGGTPSRLGPAGISELLCLVRQYANIEEGAEITIEANPDDVSVDAARQWRKAGVNRASLGVQSFDDAVLQWMHRVHDAETAEKAMRDLREAGFENVSLDLIFALPESLNRLWEQDLATAIELDPEHISLYGLTIEPATPLGRWRDRKAVAPAGEELYAAEFITASRLARAAGYEQYEVSNFAKPSFHSRHNSAYWSGASYSGIGPSAHSFDGESRSWNVSGYVDWAQRLERNEVPTADTELLSEENRRSEKVYLGLRTRSGLAMSEGDRDAVDLWTRAGWAEMDESVVRLTPEGWLRLDALAARLTGI